MTLKELEKLFYDYNVVGEGTNDLIELLCSDYIIVSKNVSVMSLNNEPNGEEYVPTNWVNDVTPLNAKNMNNIETGIETAFNKVLILDEKIGFIDLALEAILGV